MQDLELLKGLQALSDATFPKKCSTCGKLYQTFEEFVQETERLRGTTGLMENVGDDEDDVLVEFYRNCSCGSTLMDFYSDRRDRSETGLTRRTLFDNVLDQLTNKGIDPTTARDEILKFMSGQKSEILNELGIKTD